MIFPNSIESGSRPASLANRFTNSQPRATPSGIPPEGCTHPSAKVAACRIEALVAPATKSEIPPSWTGLTSIEAFSRW